MFVFLPLFFIVVSVSEIAVFLVLGKQIGIGYTLFSIVATAVVGTSLMRHQGLATLKRAQSNLEQGILPTTQLADGLLILAAGLLLLTPGFITDSVGFLLLFPVTRLPVRIWLLSLLKDKAVTWQMEHPRASEMEIVDPGDLQEEDNDTLLP